MASIDLFIVKWEVIDDHTTTIVGFTNDNICVRIPDFRNYVYLNAPNNVTTIKNRNYRFIHHNKPASVAKKFFMSRKEMAKWRKGYSGEYYEDDIQILIKFLSELKLDHVGWVRVTNYHEAGVKITSCLKEYIVTARNVKNMNDAMHVVPDVKVLSFDIECYTDNKGMSDARNDEDFIFMISMVFSTMDARECHVLALKPHNFVAKEPKFKTYKLTLFDDEFTMLGEFFKMIVDNDPKIIIGYNILGFDMKYIMYRYYSELANIPHAGRTLSSTLRDEIIHKSWKSAAYGIQDNVIINFTGRCCFDIYSYLKMEVPMQKYSLDYVSSEILGRNKLDLSYKDMFDYYRQGRVVEIADYCFVDSDLALELWYKLRLWYAAVEQSKLFKVHIHELHSSGQQKKIFNQLYFYAHSRNYIFDKEKNFRHNFSYQGATVLDPQPGMFTNCAVVDFASLYPSIIIAENICYTTLTKDQTGWVFTKEFKGIVPGILEHLIGMRKNIKALMKDEQDEVMKTIYDKRQFAYKVATNSFYGAFGSRDNRYLQMVSGAEMVTRRGREFLGQAMDTINTLGCKVVYGDTDSCFFIGGDKELGPEQVNVIVEKINQAFPPPVHVEFEKFIDCMLLLAKKKYVYRIGDVKKSKGVITARRDTCLWVRQVYSKVVNIIMEGASNNDVNAYLRSELESIYRGDVGLDRLYINRNMGMNYKSETYPLNIFAKVLARAENREVQAGERLEFYYVKSSARLQGYHYATKYMINKYNLDVDYDYYVQRQLGNPISQIYSVLNWSF